MNKISFENMPLAISELINEVAEIRKILADRKPRAPDSNKMTAEKTLLFLKNEGYILSKSKLYKLTSVGAIPYYKFGKHLIFLESEIKEWLNNQTINPKDRLTESMKEVSKNAMFKYNKILK